MKVIADGQTIELGTTEAQPTIGIIDYSRRETDEFGVTNVVQRGFARRMSVRLHVPTSGVDALQRRLASLRATPAQWVADEQYASLSFTGFYKDFQIDLAAQSVSFCTLTIEGLAETSSAADAGGDPAADGRPSTLRVLQPQTVTEAMLVASNVSENDYPAWASGATYALGARVIAAHRIYESAAAGNVGNDPAAGSTAWINLGPTNRWAMFDEALGSLTERSGNIAVVIDPVDAVNAIALLDVTGSTVRVQASGYDRTLSVPSSPGMVTFLDLPDITGAITVTVNGSGTISVGTLLMGHLVGLGVTEASPTAAITDYSRKETDDFGDVTVVERAWAKRMAVRALLRSDAVDAVANRIASVRARPCLWIGEASLEALSIYGFFKDFSIEVGENVSTLSLSVEGLSNAGKVAPLIGDVSWTDIKDDDPAHPKPQDGATVGATPAERDTINGLVTGAATIDAALAAAQAAIAQAQADIAEISGAVEGDFGPLMQAINDLENEVDVVQGNITSLQSAASAVQQSVNGLQTGLSGAQGSIADLQSQAGQIIASIGQVGTEVDQLEATVSTQGGYITTLQQSVTGLSGSVSTLSQTVATQGSSISTLQQTVSTAQGDLASLRLDLSAGGGNLLQNTDVAIDTSGWGFHYSGESGPVVGDRGPADDPWSPPGENVLRIRQTDATAAGFSEWDQYVAVKAGEWYDASALCAAHRCNVEVYIQFFDAAGGSISAPSTGQFSTPPGAKNLSDWSHRGIKAQAPSNATRARIILRKWPTSGGSDSYAWFCRPQIAVTTAGAATPKAYAPGSARSTISVQAQALTTLGTSYAALESRVSSAEGSVTSIAQSLTNANGSISSLQQSVSSLNGSVSSLAQSASTQAGQISALQISVNTQGASISTNAQAITTLQGSVSSLNTIVTASSNPNLLPNGGFENGLRGWNNSSSGGVANAWFRTANAAWGSYAVHSTAWTGQASDTYGILESDVISGLDVDSFYTIAADADIRPNGQTGAWAALQIKWATPGGPIFSDITSPVALPAGGIGFSDSGATRAAFKLTRQVPSGTTGLTVRLVTYAPQGVQINSMAWRQVKLERGQIATPYSGEASAGQVFTAYSDLNSSFASLSTTVSSQGGSITTLQQSFTSLNGTVSSLSQTVSAQGGSISSLQQVQSTQAGMIATLQTQVKAGGGNLLVNTDLAVDLRGWDYGTQNGSIFGVNLPSDDWHPAGESVLTISQQNANAGGYSEYAQFVAVEPGKYYDFSCLCAAHRCYVEVIAQWQNSAGGEIYANSQGAFAPGGGGSLLSGFTMRSFNVVAPAGAIRVRLYLRKYGTREGTDSYAWFLRPQVAETLAGASSPVAYSVGSARATINFQAQAISTLNGQQASLSSTVATQGASISQQATAISTLQGQQASLSSTVSTQGAAISSLQTATSTLQGDAATLRTQLTAGNPNLLKNGGFELGNLNYWTPVGAAFSVYGGTDTWGVYAVNGSNVPDGSNTYLETNKVSVEEDYYTVSADVGYFCTGSGAAYLELVFWNNDSFVSQVGGASRAPSFNFSADGYTRRLLKATGYRPGNANRVSARVVWYKSNGVAQSMHVRQMKLERGQNATAYSSEATVRQTFEALSTIDTQYASLSSTVGVLGASVSTNASAISNLQGQYASLSSTVSTLGASVTTNAQAITTLQGRTAAFWQVTAVAGGRAQLTVYADANGGAGVDIVGDLRVSGDVLIGGTVNPEALKLDRFVKRDDGTGSGSPSRGQSLLLYADNLGVTTPNGSYVMEVNCGFQTSVGNSVSTLNGKPFSRVDSADGGLRIALSKNGAEFWSAVISAAEYQQQNNTSVRGFATIRTFIADAPGGSDGASGNVVISVYAVQGQSDTGVVDGGDSYTQQRSATYTSFTFAMKTKWTFI